MKNIILVLALFLVFQSIAQQASDSLTQELSALVAQSEIPGFSVALVSKDKILYKNGFGYANKTTQQTFKITTIQNIASITKTFIGVALMQQIEAGKIQLDDDINKFLPFKL